MRDENGINIEQYLGVWAMHQPLLMELADHIRTLDLAAHVALMQGTRTRDPGPGGIGQYELREDGIAVIDMAGTMTKYGSSLSQMAYGTVGVRRALRNAIADQAVRAIVLRIDSPGGNFAGTADLADDVAAATRVKPVTAYIEDLGASAAYFVASQAGRIVANQAAEVGSIGTYGVVMDSSGMAAREGIKVHVVKAGKYKGMGVPGTEVTSEQLVEMQRVVDDANALFTAAVARGRPLSADRVAELADGRVHIAAEALKLNLIDGIQTFDAAVKSMRNTGAGRSSKQTSIRSKTMSNDNDTATPAAPVAATLSELKSAFPTSTADWREECLEQGLTMGQAQAAWSRHLEAQLAQRDKALADEQAKRKQFEEQAAAKTTAAGNKPLETGTVATVDGADPNAQIRSLVDERMRETGKPRHDCYAMVMRENPDLRAAIVAAKNSR